MEAPYLTERSWSFIFLMFFSTMTNLKGVLPKKGLFMKMPIRPIFKLIYMLTEILNVKDPDGRAGVTYAILHALRIYD